MSELKLIEDKSDNSFILEFTKPQKIKEIYCDQIDFESGYSIAQQEDFERVAYGDNRTFAEIDFSGLNNSNLINKKIKSLKFVDAKDRGMDTGFFMDDTFVPCRLTDDGIGMPLNGYYERLIDVALFKNRLFELFILNHVECCYD